MKLITLNIWGGRVRESLEHFVENRSNDIDIFCFQEVFAGSEPTPLSPKASKSAAGNIYSVLAGLLPDHTGFHAVAYRVEGIPYGLALFVSKKIEIEKYGVHEIFTIEDGERIYGEKKIPNRLLQHVSIRANDLDLTVYNFHGITLSEGKGDHPARIEQSEKVGSFIQESANEKILCGDFNLNPETESMRILGHGMRNLITEYRVPSTRTRYHEGESKFADYVLASPGIEVLRFEVLPDLVSDHAPLLLEFNVPRKAARAARGRGPSRR